LELHGVRPAQAVGTHKTAGRTPRPLSCIHGNPVSFPRAQVLFLPELPLFQTPVTNFLIVKGKSLSL
jgi:hypothetical protein